ncbi:MAG: SufE family protein [Rickettsiales bacterium]|jgi:sulfur transfer protein SufE|nr:SufE family protein [Rickettsiales bacterium]
MEDFNDIAALMASLPGDEERLEYLMELGGKLPKIPAGEAGAEIKGCASKVEILKKGADFYAAADSKMVAGLVYLILSLASGKTDEEIRAADFLGKISQLGLPIGQSRVIGLKAMEKFLKV